jgi:hypothetical protein
MIPALLAIVTPIAATAALAYATSVVVTKFNLEGRK